MINLFTVLYGNNFLYELELFGSLYSAWHHHGNEALEVSVLTDRYRASLDEYPFKINQIRISDEEWEAWTSGGKEKHLVKMYTMKKMLEQSVGPVIFFDTDVIFTASLRALVDKIDAHSTLMQAPEGTLGQYPVWSSFVASLSADDSVYAKTISMNSPMYNSGIVGMMPEHAPLMKEAIELAEGLYSRQSIFNIEQFATGKILSERTQLSTCETEVLHYWGWRRKFIHIEIERLRSRISGASWEDGVGIDVIQTSPVVNLADRVLTFFWGLLHRDDQQRYLRFSYLSYLSSLRSAQDAPIANAWLENSLAFIAKYVDANGENKNGVNIHFLNNFASNPPAWLSAENLNAARNMVKTINRTTVF